MGKATVPRAAQGSVKIVLTVEEVIELRTAMIVRLHVERVNGHSGERQASLLRKLGWVEPERIVTPPEGEGTGG